MRWAIDSFVRLTEEAYAMRLLGASAAAAWLLEAAEILRLRGGRVSAYYYREGERIPDGRVGVSFGASETRYTSHFNEDEFEQMTREEYLDAYRF